MKTYGLLVHSYVQQRVRAKNHSCKWVAMVARNCNHNEDGTQQELLRGCNVVGNGHVSTYDVGSW